MAAGGNRVKGISVLLVTANYGLEERLKKAFLADSAITAVITANNAYTARDKIIEFKPDVMVLCRNLPRMDGITFLKKLIPQYPMPAIVLAPAYCRDEVYAVGGMDFIEYDEDDFQESGFFNPEGIVYRIKRIVTPNFQSVPVASSGAGIASDKEIIAMGASTGGTQAIAQVIKELKKDIPGIVMVQHMPAGFTKMYAERLDSECEVCVREAKTGDIVKRGQVLLAPGDRHMKLVKVNGVYQVECRGGEKVSGHCPSVDILFESVARVAGENAIGVLMTGMGQDGAKGLLAMRKAGARTIGQDERTCVVYGMPKAAYDIGAVTWQVPLEYIPQKIYSILRYGGSL